MMKGMKMKGRTSIRIRWFLSADDRAATGAPRPLGRGRDQLRPRAFRQAAGLDRAVLVEFEHQTAQRRGPRAVDRRELGLAVELDRGVAPLRQLGRGEACLL